MKPIDDYIYNEDDLPLDQNTVAELSIECKFQKKHFDLDLNLVKKGIFPYYIC